MKIISKYLLILSFLASFSVSLANAQSYSPKSLAVNFTFSDIWNGAIKSLGETLDFQANTTTATSTAVATSTNSSAEQISTSTDFSTDIATDTSTTSLLRDSCDYLDDALSNILSLENSSTETRIKIDKLESTIDGETPFRDSILSSLKDFAVLQKKDKAVIAAMKKNIAEARDYYDDLNLKTDETQNYLDENFCEDVKLDEAVKISSTTKAQVVSEAIFRKQLSAGLKDKVKFLQNSVASAKKK